MDNKVYYGEYSLRHWIDLILSKNIVLPAYQRYFVWDENKVETLIQAFRDKHFIPPVTIGSFKEEDEIVNLVLDGQQRLTSILLAYLGIYPDKNTFKKDLVKSQAYNDAMENGDDEDEQESDNVLEWNFSKLQERGRTKNKITKDLGKYYKVINYNIDDEFLDNNYLGFSFLVPENDDSNTQQKYYSSVFRAINIQGETLLPGESRASLYYLNKDLESFFAPKFIENYKIRLNNINVHVDFVRYLSLLTQYIHTNNISQVAKGSKQKMEKYYEEYIFSVVNGSNSSKFGLFSKIFKNNEFKHNFEEFEKQISVIKKKFNSIIELDLTFFGLIYYVIFKGKSVDIERIQDINYDIEKENKKIRDNANHTRSPNSLKFLRERILTSIKIYEGYIK